jgi:hypothetical protein
LLVTVADAASVGRSAYRNHNGNSPVAKAKNSPAQKQVRKKQKTPRDISYDDVCKLALDLPGVEESTSYGTPALKVRGKLLARLKEDGQTLVLRTTPTDRVRLLIADPTVFYLTDHYLNYPLILIRLSHIDRPLLAELITEAHRLAAAKS